MRPFILRTGLLLAALACAALPAAAQLVLTIDTLDAARFPDMRAKVRVRNGTAAVPGLTVANFTVREDGIVQAPVSGYCEDTLQTTNVSVLLIIDRSGSMGWLYGNAIVDAKRAAKSFVDRLSSGDECALVSFADDVAYNQSWTNNATLMKTQIDALATSGGTRLWDAVVTGTNLLRPRTRTRVMIVLTDGDDNRSMETFSTALSTAVNAGITVFTIGLGSQLTPANLRTLATQTGGKYYETQNASDLDAIYAAISQQVLSRGVCELRYRSKLDCYDGSLHVVDIAVTTGGDTESDQQGFRLPYDPATFSYVTLEMATDHIVESGKTIAVPLVLSTVSANRPPRNMQFTLVYDRALLALDSARADSLTAGYTITLDPRIDGTGVLLQGATPLTRPGTVATLYFTAAETEQTRIAQVAVSPPDVNQTCTQATSSDGVITVSGFCQRALRPGAGTGPAARTVLRPNAPNPFNPSTRLTYTLAERGPVRIVLYDAIGREMKVLLDEVRGAGDYALLLDGSGLANGLYYVTLLAGGENHVQRIMLVK
jgi:VWFA-related protein